MIFILTFISATMVIFSAASLGAEVEIHRRVTPWAVYASVGCLVWLVALILGVIYITTIGA